MNPAQVRAGLYQLLGLTLVKSPGQEMIKLWTDPALLAELRCFFSATTCEQLEQALRQAQSHPRALKLAYDALFLVPVKGKCITPYESVYREDHYLEGKKIKLLMGRSAQAVEDFIRKAGLEAPLEVQELPDHIGMELLLMACLCAQEHLAEERKDQAEKSVWQERQRQFLREHLSEWIHPLTADLQTKATHPFFKALSAMLLELVEQELEYLVSDAKSEQGFGEAEK